MAKSTQTPGTALNALLKKHGLNYNRLAKAIGLSSAMVRLIARDENPVSASVAFRLAKFFKTKPEYWLVLQMDFDNAKAAHDKKLAKALKDIPTIDKAMFERKPRTAKASPSRGKKAAKKGSPARGKKAAAKPKTAAKSAARGAASKKAAPKKAVKGAAVKKTVSKKPAGKRGRPAAPKKAAVKAPVVKKARPAPQPSPVKKMPVITVKPEPKPVEIQQPVQQQSVPSDTTINEPQI
jgi:adenylate kinase